MGVPPPPPPPQVLKLGGAVLEAGRQLVGSSRALAVGLREMGGGPKRDPLLKVRTPPPKYLGEEPLNGGGGHPKIERFGVVEFVGRSWG